MSQWRLTFGNKYTNSTTLFGKRRIGIQYLNVIISYCVHLFVRCTRLEIIKFNYWNPFRWLPENGWTETCQLYWNILVSKSLSNAYIYFRLLVFVIIFPIVAYGLGYDRLHKLGSKVFRRICGTGPIFTTKGLIKWKQCNKPLPDVSINPASYRPTVLCFRRGTEESPVKTKSH